MFGSLSLLNLKLLTNNMIRPRRYLGQGRAQYLDFYTDFNVVVMVMALCDCSSQSYLTIIAASQSTL